MSKIKSPDEKKKLSYQLDCRNTYGENSKSSRKNIPRNKQIGHQKERRVVRHILAASQLSSESDLVTDVQSDISQRGDWMRLHSFRKASDTPLGEVVKKKLKRRIASIGAKKTRRGT